MSSLERRDPKQDDLLTPENSALLLIDYQPLQIETVKSMDHERMIKNVVLVAETARLFNIPTVLSSVNVKRGLEPTIPQLRGVFPNLPELDRTGINAWEDREFLEAVKVTGRKKLIMAALWTEACLAFPALDALREGYQVYPVVDAVGGTSKEAHEAALARIQQAGARLTSLAQLACELQRDWNRHETAKEFTRILVALKATDQTIGPRPKYVTEQTEI